MVERKIKYLLKLAAKSLQSCPTMCDPIEGSPPDSPVPGILLEWVAISFSSAWKWKVKVKLLSHVQPLATPWTAAYQAPLSMGFSRQEYWSGVPLPSPFTEAYTLVKCVGGGRADIFLNCLLYAKCFSFWTWCFWLRSCLTDVNISVKIEARMK